MGSPRGRTGGAKHVHEARGIKSSASLETGKLAISHGILPAWPRTQPRRLRTRPLRGQDVRNSGSARTMRVPKENRLTLSLAHAVGHLGGDLPRPGIGPVATGKITGPHDALGVEHINDGSHAPVVLKRRVHTFVHLFGRRPFDASRFKRPAMSLPRGVHAKTEMGEPAGIVLNHDDPQFGMPLEHAA